MSTVGDLKRQGKNGLHIQCSGCGYIVIAWWQTLGVPDDRQLEAVIRQLRCDRCGTRPRPLDVRPYQQGEESAGLVSRRSGDSWLPLVVPLMNARSGLASETAVALSASLIGNTRPLSRRAG